MDVLGKLFGRSVDLVGKTLDLRLKKHSHIASNLANIDTPNNEVKDLQFQKILQKSLPDPSGNKLRMVSTNVRHMPVKDVERAYQRAQKNVVYGVYGRDETGRDIMDIDREMTKLVKNHLLYNTTVQMLAKKFEGIKYAITEGGR